MDKETIKLIESGRETDTEYEFRMYKISMQENIESLQAEIEDLKQTLWLQGIAVHKIEPATINVNR